MGEHASTGNVHVRVNTPAGPRCRGCAASLAKLSRARAPKARRKVLRKPVQILTRCSKSIGIRNQQFRPQNLFEKVLSLNLCPKALTNNIPEYVVLRDVLQRGLADEWPLDVWLQTWIVLQGIRGKEGIEDTERVMGNGMPK